MVRARLSGVNTVRKRLADGTVATYFYHRASGHRLPGKPGSPEFLRAFADAEKLLLDRHAGTFTGLIRDFTLSPEFAKRADSTRREYARMLTKAEARFGNMPIAALDDQRVLQDFLAWRADVAKDSGEREGDNRLSVISAMLSWARQNGRIGANHLAGFKRLHHADRSEMIWQESHVAAFMDVAPVELQRAMILALHTGQRQGDLLKMAWSNYDGQAIEIRQGKSGRKVTIPCTSTLRMMLDQTPRTSTVILTTRTGRAWKGRHFKAQWAKAAEAAGIVDLHFHDLRGTAVTILAELECTHIEIAAITGHSLRHVTSILDRYLARTRVLAGKAIERLENAKETQFANRLQTTAPKSKEGSVK